MEERKGKLERKGTHMVRVVGEVRGSKIQA
jgi:hypothetical protein